MRLSNQAPFGWMAARWECTGVQFTGMDPGGMPTVQFTWAETDDENGWWAWEIFLCYCAAGGALTGEYYKGDYVTLSYGSATG